MLPFTTTNQRRQRTAFANSNFSSRSFSTYQQVIEIEIMKVIILAAMMPFLSFSAMRWPWLQLEFGRPSVATFASRAMCRRVSGQ
jgi:hypothetical protein